MTLNLSRPRRVYLPHNPGDNPSQSNPLPQEQPSATASSLHSKSRNHHIQKNSKTTESTTTVPEAKVAPETIELKNGVTIPIYLDGVNAENARHLNLCGKVAVSNGWPQSQDSRARQTPRGNTLSLRISGFCFFLLQTARCKLLPEDVDEKVDIHIADENLKAVDDKIDVQVTVEDKDDEPSNKTKAKRASRISRLYSKIFSE
ncbi:hypothetical protein BDW69DRAFT_180228 [Aspergillus filifer]